MFFHQRWFILILLILCYPSVLLFAQLGTQLGTSTATNDSQSLLSQWLSDLDDDRFIVRRRAMRKLVDARAKAIPLVANAACSTSREVAGCSVNILATLANSPDRKCADDAIDALNQIASSSRPVSQEAEFAVRKYQKRRKLEVIDTFTRLGADIDFRRGSSGTQGAIVRMNREWKGDNQDVAKLRFLQPVSWISFEHSRLGNDALSHLAGFSSVQKLYLGNSRVTGVGLASLYGLSSLTHLSLQHLQVQDDELTGLYGLASIQSLGLDDTPITNAGLPHLNAVPYLEELWLDRTDVTDVGLKLLLPLAELKKLHLVETNVAGPGLGHLTELPKLERLWMKGVKLDEPSLKLLSQLVQLKELGLDYTPLHDDHLFHLSYLNHLEILWLSKTAVSDVGLQHLKTLTNLRKLYLHGTKVTTEGAAELDHILPHCKIYR